MKYLIIFIRPKNKQKSMYYQKQKAHRRLTLAAFRTRIDAQLDNDALKKRKEIEKRKQDLVLGFTFGNLIICIENF